MDISDKYVGYNRIYICLYLEWVARGSLETVLFDTSIELSWPLSLRIATQLAHGLQYLHSKHVSMHLSMIVYISRILLIISYTDIDCSQRCETS